MDKQATVQPAIKLPKLPAYSRFLTTPDPEFISCACASEGISVSVDDELPFDVHLAFWKYGFQTKTQGFWERIRWCWRILTTGKPWTDFLILPQSEITRLVTALLKRRMPS